MSDTVNKVILIGNIGNDPEIRVLEDRTKLAHFSMATSESYVDKITGKNKKITDWHNIVMWRGLAEIAEKYLVKGQKIYIEGKLKNRAWKDGDNSNKYTSEIVVKQLVMLSEGRTNKFQPPDFSVEATTENLKSLPSDLIVNEEDDDLPF